MSARVEQSRFGPCATRGKLTVPYLLVPQGRRNRRVDPMPQSTAARRTCPSASFLCPAGAGSEEGPVSTRAAFHGLRGAREARAALHPWLHPSAASGGEETGESVGGTRPRPQVGGGRGQGRGVGGTRPWRRRGRRTRLGEPCHEKVEGEAAVAQLGLCRADDGHPRTPSESRRLSCILNDHERSNAPKRARRWPMKVRDPRLKVGIRNIVDQYLGHRHD